MCRRRERLKVANRHELHYIGVSSLGAVSQPPGVSINDCKVRPQFRRKGRAPTRVDQPDVEQVAQVRAILVAEGRQLDPHQRLQRKHAERPGLLGLAHVRVRQHFLRPDLLPREDDMDRVALFACGPSRNRSSPAE